VACGPLFNEPLADSDPSIVGYHPPFFLEHVETMLKFLRFEAGSADVWRVLCGPYC
jgi:hypothetical protein